MILRSIQQISFSDLFILFYNGSKTSSTAAGYTVGGQNVQTECGLIIQISLSYPSLCLPCAGDYFVVCLLNNTQGIHSLSIP